MGDGVILTVAVWPVAGKVGGAVTVQVLLVVPPAGMVSEVQVLPKPGGSCGLTGTGMVWPGFSGTLDVTVHVAA